MPIPRRSSLTTLALCACLPALPAAAQEGVLLDEIVVSAPDGAGSPDRPQGASTIGPEQLRREFPGASVADLVHTMPGVTTQGSADDPGTAINIRGMQDHGRVAVTVDGARQNFQKSDHGPGGTFYADPEMLKRIEVVRGPGGPGGGAVGGSVSLTTIDAGDVLEPGARTGGLMRLRFGSHDRAPTVHTALATRLGGHGDVLLAFTRARPGDYRAGNGQLVPSAQDMESGLFKLRAHAGDHGFSLSAQHYANRFTTGLGLTTARDTRVRDRTHVLGYSFTPAGPWEIEARLYSTGTRLSQQPLDAAGQPSGTPRSYRTGTEGGTLTATGRFATGALDHELTLGLDAFRDRVRTDDPAAPGTGLTPSGDRRQTSAFLHDRIVTADGRFEAGLGLRHDRGLSSAAGTSGGGRFSPQLSLIWRPSDRLGLYAGYARGFRAPALSEALVDGVHPPPATFPIVPNPDLRPEISRNIEAGVTLRFDEMFTGGDLIEARAGVFRNDVRDYIGITRQGGAFDAFYRYENIARVRIEGIEIEARYDSPALFASLAGQAIRGRDRVTGDDISRIVPHRLVLGLGTRALDGRLTLGARATLSGRRNSAQFAGEPWRLLDLYAAYAVSERIEAHLALSNVFDRHYTRYLNTHPAPGFNARATLTVRF